MPNTELGPWDTKKREPARRDVPQSRLKWALLWEVRGSSSSKEGLAQLGPQRGCSELIRGVSRDYVHKGNPRRINQLGLGGNGDLGSSGPRQLQDPMELGDPTLGHHH